MSTGMMALYVIVAGLVGVGLLVGGFLFMRRKTNDSELDINDELLEKDNVK